MSLLLGRPARSPVPEVGARPDARSARPARRLPAPFVAQRQDRPGRRGATLLAALAVGAVSSLLVGDFWTAVQQRAPRTAYASPLLGQSFIRSPEQGPRAFFRFQIPLTTLPETATLWVQGDQAVTPYLNGVQLAPTPKLPPTSDMPKQVDSIDLLPGLVRGDDVVGVEAVNLADEAPSFEARLVLGYGLRDLVLATTARGWLSTTDVALTGESFPDTGTFSDPGLSTSGWQQAGVAAPWRGATAVAVAPLADTAPPSRPALAGAAGDDQLTASTTLRLSGPCDDGWLRVAASGSYSVSLDGQLVAESLGDVVPFGERSSLAPPPLPVGRAVPLAVYDICPVLGAGRSTLTISVSGAVNAVIYADGMVRSGSTVTT
ncbi:MAG TPA: hypothetical protein VMD59_01700, partial [Acidimicrobiales bacterium]|nr:hypothetical protein [Acidimicrobiales bacterium]